MVRLHRCFWLVGVLLLAVSACGGPQAAKQVKASGKVTLDGKPLPQGTISFSLNDGTPSSTGEIKDGAYEVQARVGKNKVEVASLKSTGKPATTMYPDAPPQMVNTISPKYNGPKTELSADVTANGPNDFNFEVHSK